MGCAVSTHNRVFVNVGSAGKHNFPVGVRCAWQHMNNVAPAGAGCTNVGRRKNGRKVEDHRDTTECFENNPCQVIGDDRELQMLILRDP